MTLCLTESVKGVNGKRKDIVFQYDWTDSCSPVVLHILFVPYTLHEETCWYHSTRENLLKNCLSRRTPLNILLIDDTVMVIQKTTQSWSSGDGRCWLLWYEYGFSRIFDGMVRYEHSTVPLIFFPVAPARGFCGLSITAKHQTVDLKISDWTITCSRLMLVNNF